MSTALDPIPLRPYHHFTQMTKFVVFLFITSGLLACHRSADNRPTTGLVLTQQNQTGLELTSRILCANANNQLITYSLDKRSSFSTPRLLNFDQRIRDYRMVSSNGTSGEFLVAAESASNPNQIQILLVDYNLEKNLMVKLFLAEVPHTASTFFEVSPGEDFALIAEQNGYVLYDLVNRQRVRTYNLNPAQFSSPRMSADGEFALFSHRFGKNIFRQILLSLSTGKGSPLPLLHPQSEPIDAQFVGVKAVAWRESKQPDRLSILPISEVQAGTQTQLVYLSEEELGAYTSYVADEETYIAIVGKTALRLIQFDSEGMSIRFEKNYPYPSSLTAELPTIQAAAWSQDILIGFNLTGKSLSFRKSNETWSFQNCFFPRLGPETIVEIHE